MNVPCDLTKARNLYKEFKPRYFVHLAESITRRCTVKAPISLDCDCFATAGDRHREWVAKQSRNSRQRFVMSSHVSPSGAK